MPSQDESNKDNQLLPSSPVDSDYSMDETTSPIKALLLGICGLGLVFSILTLLPMFFTYLSDGDFRAPAEIHPTDTAARLNSQYISNKDKHDPKEPINPSNTAKKFSNTVQ